ncbi:hypothetical protein DWV75_15005 [Ruminococcus sp. AF12-5]|nr:hypothetical protein DWV75_15005 [Ruminococcus sp. AF12-5]
MHWSVCVDVPAFFVARKSMKIGGTTYEVSTHFNPKGRQCLLEQFKELILSEDLTSLSGVAKSLHPFILPYILLCRSTLYPLQLLISA